MEILLPENKPFNLNQPKNKLIDSKMCVFDYSDKDDKDFLFKKITTFFHMVIIWLNYKLVKNIN